MVCTSASNSTGGVVKSVHVANKMLGLVFLPIWMMIVLFCRSKVVAIDVAEPFQAGTREELGHLLLLLTSLIIDPGCYCIKTPPNRGLSSWTPLEVKQTLTFRLTGQINPHLHACV